MTTIDLNALRSYRYGRVQQQLIENDVAAALLANPVNIRYAIDSRNMAVWTLHNQARYCVVPAEGPPVLFEYANNNCLGIAQKKLPPSPKSGSPVSTRSSTLPSTQPS